MTFRKTEQSMHKRVAYRLHQRGFQFKEICALFGITHVSFYNWIRHTKAVIR